MKIRESGMPKEEEWNQFFDPNQVLRLLGLNHHVVILVVAMELSQYLLQE